MSAAQPYMSMIAAAATRYVLTAGDFAAGSPFNAAIEDLRFVTGVTVIYKHSAAGPHYLSLLPDIAGGSPTVDPLDELEVAPSNQAAPTGGACLRRASWLPPLACSRLDIVFADKTWEAAGRAFFKPSSDILVVVYGYPSRFTG